MRKEAVFAAIIAIIIIATLAILIGREFAKDTITGYSILSSPQEMGCPVQDGVVTAGWHDQSYYDQFKSVHEGVDFANNGGNPATCGREVRAMAAGEASFMPYSNTAGNYVIIDHGEGVITRYLHLNGYAGNPGESKRVRKGEIIGYMGSTGKSTGCHLHFEIKTASQTVDPLQYVCRKKCGENWCDTISSLSAEEKQLLIYVDKETGIERNYPDASSLTDLRSHVQNVRAADSRAGKLLVEDLKALMVDAEANGIQLYVQSAYRSYESQSALFSGYVRAEQQAAMQQGNPITEEEAKRRANVYSAYPGRSEHQLGTAIDFSTPENGFGLETDFEETAAGKWLLANAEQYGFVLSYPKGKEHLTGYQYEPWHYRYIGKRLALELAAKDYKGNNDVTPNSFIQEILESDATEITSSDPKTAAKEVKYDVNIKYEAKPSFRERINYDLAEIEKVRETAEKIAECKTDDCVKQHSNKEIEGLTWKIGTCENSDEEKFNELAQLISDCSSTTDDYCTCGKYKIELGSGYDIELKEEKITLLRDGKALLTKEGKIELYSPATSQREEANAKLSDLCAKTPDFCEKNEIEIAKFGNAAISRRSLASSGLPYYKKCGTKRLILVDAAPSNIQYNEKDLAAINTAYRMVNRLKDTDEGIAITKLSKGIPQGGHSESIDFVNSNKDAAQAYITLIAGDSFSIRHSSNEKSRKLAEALRERLSAKTEEINLPSNEAKDFLIGATKIYEKDIPIVTLTVLPASQEKAENAIYEAMAEYFGNFAEPSRKQIYPFCVESSQKIMAYDEIKGTAGMQPMRYKFAVRLN